MRETFLFQHKACFALSTRDISINLCHWCALLRDVRIQQVVLLVLHVKNRS
ncbi:hypothetical protein D187_005490 [Cystobacter fuscus DSM 2262]|uniref:Uncharacterized protein n=1 Tax=Cystobacter fuscus (strain ATCC 25194 / DSM 2262 / NBRC 100088 / M29) TaxID=1242864 RepID=S9PMU5_CYSF2|nr:hypothetical protein D187_005490 [Cystobacter fuscus DSM 2262]